MKTKQIDTRPIPKLPPENWNKVLAEACGVSAMTVTRAIRYNGAGEKAEMVRAKYRELFMNDNQIL